MNRLETAVAAIRHSDLLAGQNWLWNFLRPLFNKVSSVVARNGLRRLINGTDSLQLSIRLRQVRECYEPDVWHRVLDAVQPGDVFVDVGAHIGLYALAAAKRTGVTGRVFAFEPDPENYALLQENCHLNELGGILITEHKAVAAQDANLSFLSGRGSESRLGPSDTAVPAVESVRLDGYFADCKIHLLKIDVEGFEQAVLEGAKMLLSNQRTQPRAIFIEVHPHCWAASGASSAGILEVLQSSGYEVRTLAGVPVSEIKQYGEIVAFPSTASNN